MPFPTCLVRNLGSEVVTSLKDSRISEGPTETLEGSNLASALFGWVFLDRLHLYLGGEPQLPKGGRVYQSEPSGVNRGELASGWLEVNSP